MKYSFPVVEADFGPVVASADDARDFVRLLEAIPDTPETRRQVWLNDFRHMWKYLEEQGIARSGKDDPPDAFKRAIGDLVGQGPAQGLMPWPDSAPFIAGGTDYFSVDQLYGDSGVDIRNAELAAKTGKGPRFEGLSLETEELEVALGDYVPEDILNRLEECAACVPHMIREYAGIGYFAWGDDFQGEFSNRLSPPWFDHLGRGGRVAVFDGELVRALSTAGIESLFDARLGRTATLADDSDIVTAASILQPWAPILAWFRRQTSRSPRFGSTWASGLSADSATGSCLVTDSWKRGAQAPERPNRSLSGPGRSAWSRPRGC